MGAPYSVLMSVYEKERPEYLRAALTSVLNQTVLPFEIVLVCDGPLTDGLEQVLESFAEHLSLVRLPQNCGLGKALAEGLLHCNCELIARVDSDDISVIDRCERQVEYLGMYPEIDVLSGTLAEFTGDAVTPQDAQLQVVSYKSLPASNQEISEYIKSRNPINHPCVMFRRSKVLEAGGYQPCSLFEDYDLWVRMYQNQCKFANIADTLVYMRVNDMHRRRGGVRYAKAIVHFWRQMYRCGMIGLPQFLFMSASRVAVSLLPNQIRRQIYDKKLRNR